MPDVKFGGKDGTVLHLREDPDLLVVRTRSRRSLRGGPVATPEADVVEGLDLVTAFPEAGVEVYRRPEGAARSTADVRTALESFDDVRFAGRVLVNETSGEPAVYTENLFVKFRDDVDAVECERILEEAGLAIKETESYATNAYFVAAPEGTGQGIFEIADRLLALPQVELCHPELIQRARKRSVFPQQWHLARTEIAGVDIDASANVRAAHALTLGEGATIAVLDDGFDLGHLEFGTAGKIVAPRDFTPNLIDSDPAPGNEDNHGTACAGVACADGREGASGVAPRAKLLPIRMPRGIGSVREADAFRWAADHGADVISCSWGPMDGDWWNDDDPTHRQFSPLPDHTRLAIDYAATQGRGGKGCLVFFAAGNGNESVDLDGYASHARVLAVAACNDRSERSVYSDHGAAVFCCFPSNDMPWPERGRSDPLTPGIWTTDRRGQAGYNRGLLSQGDAAGNYTNGFGGTSSACPGAAGVAALVISRNPALRAGEVKEILRRACLPIDPQGGQYDDEGHSAMYGYGRLDAHAAAQLALTTPVPADAVMA
jgi:subtilisin family serine protease